MTIDDMPYTHMSIWSRSYDYEHMITCPISVLYWGGGVGGMGQPRPQPDPALNSSKSPVDAFMRYLTIWEYAICPYGNYIWAVVSCGSAWFSVV